jgi:hypothetical protein
MNEITIFTDGQKKEILDLAKSAGKVIADTVNQKYGENFTPDQFAEIYIEFVNEFVGEIQKGI